MYMYVPVVATKTRNAAITYYLNTSQRHDPSLSRVYSIMAILVAAAGEANVYDVVIVGGGIAGMATAIGLLRRG
jgi:NADPH-dependent 2,4-dienoyl-CoA reductase/sulfur reductase-like enzyme